MLQEGRKVTATIVGDGPDRAQFQREVAKQGLGEQVQFVGARPARQAFGLGRLLVVPSRAESLPYIVLEAAAAGVPMIASQVGGIPEIFGSDLGSLVAPGDPAGPGAGHQPGHARPGHQTLGNSTAEDAAACLVLGRRHD